MIDAMEDAQAWPDQIEEASASEEKARQIGVKAIRRLTTGVGSSECETCLVAIPEARRKAAPWATRCVDCQSIAEKQGIAR